MTPWDDAIRRKLPRYRGEWVVFADDRVVAHASSRTEAISRIPERARRKRLEVIYSPRKRSADTIWSAS
jgi:hypothetical protein